MGNLAIDSRPNPLHCVRTLTGASQVSPISAVGRSREVLALLGPDASNWAVLTSRRIAAQTISSLTPTGAEPDIDAYRATVEAVTLHGLAYVAGGALGGESIPEVQALVDQYVYRGVPAEQVVRVFQTLHAALSATLLDAIADGLSGAGVAGGMSQVSARLHEFMSGTVDAAVAGYEAARRRWHASPAAKRDETIARIKDGHIMNSEDATRMLRYPIHAVHLALIVKVQHSENHDCHEAARLVRGWLANVKPAATLVIPHGAQAWIWTAWPNSMTRLCQLQQAQPPGLHAWAGTPSFGLQGFRESHLEAERAATLPLPDGRAGLVSYRDIELELLLSSDSARVHGFVQRELGPLAEDTPRAADLRRTLLAYLAAERSTSRAASLLHVAKNTVTYRVNQATELLGRDLSERQTELVCALRLAVHDSSYAAGQLA